jgi:hypothetical protein
MHRKEENQTENQTNPWFKKSVQNNQSMKKIPVCSWTAFCRKAKTKEETLSLRILRVCPETLMNLYYHEFHLWIDSYTSNETGVTKYYLCSTVPRGLFVTALQ